MIQKILLFVGIFCLGLYVTFTVQALRQQEQLEQELEEQLDQGRERRRAELERDLESFKPRPVEKAAPKTMRKLKEGDLVGRLEIPRLDVSVMVMEGTASRTLRLGAGRIPGTAYPWSDGNVGIAAHRDSFFRPLAGVKKDDMITLTTVEGTSKYRVTSTQIVTPLDVHVLQPTKKNTLTLVTCYPFNYIGSAPKRFIVHATKD